MHTGNLQTMVYFIFTIGELKERYCGTINCYKNMKVLFCGQTQSVPMVLSFSLKFPCSPITILSVRDRTLVYCFKKVFAPWKLRQNLYISYKTLQPLCGTVCVVSIGQSFQGKGWMLWALEGAFFNFLDLWGNVSELCAKASSLSIEATASKMERLLIQVVEWFWSIRRSVTARRRFSCSSQCSSLRTEL